MRIYAWLSQRTNGVVERVPCAARFGRGHGWDPHSLRTTNHGTAWQVAEGPGGGSSFPNRAPRCAHMHVLMMMMAFFMGVDACVLWAYVLCDRRGDCERCLPPLCAPLPSRRPWFVGAARQPPCRPAHSNDAPVAGGETPGVPVAVGAFIGARAALCMRSCMGRARAHAP